MKWVIEEIIYNGDNMVKMEKALNELNIPYIIINVCNNLKVIDKLTRIPNDTDAYEELQRFINSEEVLMYGSLRLRNKLEELKIYPGTYAIDNILDYCNIKEQIPGELLNEEYIRGCITEIEPKWDKFFIRPIANNKLINGQVLSVKDYKEIQEDELASPTRLSTEDIMISELKDIHEEYRFFVVNKKVTAGSSYRVHGLYNTDKEVYSDIKEYAQDIASKLDVCMCYTLDIAKVNNGYKVVELNDLVTSGLYEANVKEILLEIERG